MNLAARSRIEWIRRMIQVAARLVRNVVYRESLDKSASDPELGTRYQEQFRNYIELGIEHQRLTPDLAAFDMDSCPSHSRPTGRFVSVIWDSDHL
jgi:ribonucleoside-diphosphate reductase alpha chain